MKERWPAIKDWLAMNFYRLNFAAVIGFTAACLHDFLVGGGQLPRITYSLWGFAAGTNVIIGVFGKQFSKRITELKYQAADLQAISDQLKEKQLRPAAVRVYLNGVAIVEQQLPLGSTFEMHLNGEYTLLRKPETYVN